MRGHRDRRPRRRTGPARDVVLINSGAALCVSERVPTMAEGIGLARERIDSGAALDKLTTPHPAHQ